MLKVHTSVIKVVPRPGSYTWLQEQLDNFNGNVFVLTQNVTFNDTYDRHQNNPYWIRGIDFKNGMLYNKTLTLNGNDNYISGDKGARIFTVSVSDIIINNMTFVNGSADKGGALLFSAAATNTQIINSNFTDNAASVSGGAIFFNIPSDNILIENSAFDSNTAPEGGAVTFNKDTSSNLYENMNIVSSNFTNNRATNANGEGGSAMLINMVYGLSFDKCIFDSNIANSNGALRFNGFNDVQYNECEFTDNEAANGGAMYYYTTGTGAHTNVEYLNCNFTNNKATVKNGGAMYVIADNVDVIGCDFTDNHAESWAGAIIVGELWINFPEVKRGKCTKGSISFRKTGRFLILYRRFVPT